MLRVVPPPNEVENRQRIAVVDDHTFMRDLIARELTRNAKRYDVVAAVGTGTIFSWRSTGSAEASVILLRRRPDSFLWLDRVSPYQFWER